MCGWMTFNGWTSWVFWSLVCVVTLRTCFDAKNIISSRVLVDCPLFRYMEVIFWLLYSRILKKIAIVCAIINMFRGAYKTMHCTGRMCNLYAIPKWDPIPWISAVSLVGLTCSLSCQSILHWRYVTLVSRVYKAMCIHPWL